MFALVMTLAGRFPEFGAMFPAWLFDAFTPNDKVNLAPFRVLHFVVVACSSSRGLFRRTGRGLRWPVFDPLIKCGEQSLAVFCVGVFLSFIGHFALIDEFGLADDADPGQRDRHRGHDHRRLLHLLVQAAGRLEDARPRLAALRRVQPNTALGSHSVRAGI